MWEVREGEELVFKVPAHDDGIERALWTAVRTLEKARHCLAGWRDRPAGGGTPDYFFLDEVENVAYGRIVEASTEAIMTLAPPGVSPGPLPLVLLVDDNADTLEMYAIGLQYEGFEVSKASDAEMALQVVSARRPDCIVADVRMPRMTGLEFRRVLSRSPGTADIPVIALTGFNAQVELDTARAAGFESVLLKPCLPETLAVEILRVLAASRAARGPARDASARATQVLAKAARLQDKSAELAWRHREIRRRPTPSDE